MKAVRSEAEISLPAIISAYLAVFSELLKICEGGCNDLPLRQYPATG